MTNTEINYALNPTKHTQHVILKGELLDTFVIIWVRVDFLQHDTIIPHWNKNVILWNFPHWYISGHINYIMFVLMKDTAYMALMGKLWVSMVIISEKTN